MPHNFFEDIKFTGQYQNEQRNTEAVTINLSDEVWLDTFRQYCAIEHSAENIEFLCELQDLYSKYGDENPPLAELQQFYDKYISPESPQALNLKPDNIKITQDALHAGETDPKIFDAVKGECVFVMGTDTGKRFIGSPLYKAIAKRKALLKKLEDSANDTAENRTELESINSALSAEDDNYYKVLLADRATLFSPLRIIKLAENSAISEIEDVSTLESTLQSIKSDISKIRESDFGLKQNENKILKLKQGRVESFRNYQQKEGEKEKIDGLESMLFKALINEREALLKLAGILPKPDSAITATSQIVRLKEIEFQLAQNEKIILKRFENDQEKIDYFRGIQEREHEVEQLGKLEYNLLSALTKEQQRLTTELSISEKKPGQNEENNQKIKEQLNKVKEEKEVREKAIEALAHEQQRLFYNRDRADITTSEYKEKVKYINSKIKGILSLQLDELKKEREAIIVLFEKEQAATPALELDRIKNIDAMLKKNEKAILNKFNNEKIPANKEIISEFREKMQEEQAARIGKIESALSEGLLKEQEQRTFEFDILVKQRTTLLAELLNAPDDRKDEAIKLSLVANEAAVLKHIHQEADKKIFDDKMRTFQSSGNIQFTIETRNANKPEEQEKRYKELLGERKALIEKQKFPEQRNKALKRLAPEEFQKKLSENERTIKRHLGSDKKKFEDVLAQEKEDTMLQKCLPSPRKRLSITEMPLFAKAKTSFGTLKSLVKSSPAENATSTSKKEQSKTRPGGSRGSQSG